MNRPSLRAVLLSGFGVMASLVVGFAAYSLHQEERLRERVEYVLGEQAQVHTMLQDLRETLNGMQRNALQGALNRDRKLLLYATSEAAELFDVFEELRQGAARRLMPDDRARLFEFLDETEDLYREIMARSFVTLANAVEGGRVDLEAVARLRLDSVQLNSAFATYLTEMRGEQAMRLQEFNDGVASLRLIGVAIAALALLAITIYFLVMRRYLTQPLLRLDRFVAGLSNPIEVAERAPVLRHDEIGSIAMALNRMLDGLQETVISRDYFDHVLAHLSNALVVIDRSGTVVTVNPAACRALGRTAEELTGRAVTDVLPLAGDEWLSGDRGVHDLETELRTPEGSATPVLLSAEPLPAEEGGWVIVATDITERRKIEEALRRSEERYRLVIESATEGILVVQDDRIVFMNPSLLRLVGHTEEETLHKEFLPFVHPDDRPRALDRYTRRMRGEPAQQHFDCRVLASSGAPLWVNFSSVMILWEGRPAILSFVSDITARKQAENDIREALEQQKELNALKSRFVSMTSHEFRTPLATILSSTELLKYYGEKLPASERAELLDSTESAVRRMTVLLDDVLMVGKAEAGRLEFRPAAMALARFCQSLVDEARALGGRDGGVSHEIELAIRGECETAMLDEKLLRHILGNLLSNAVKYSPRGGRIAFSVDGRGRDFEFVVADQGIGIPEEEQPRLFKTFFRARNVGNISGTGLGLAIAKHAIDLHGGTIEVQSKAGAGTRFIVTLPREVCRHG